MSGVIVPALIALLPAMVGPFPIEQGSAALVLALCGGGEVSISLDGDSDVLPYQATTPCCAKGCRNSQKRRPS
jgi:hypothetical protein